MKSLLLVMALFAFGNSQTTQNSEDAEIPDTSSKPNSRIASVEGDLTKDGIPERVEIWDIDSLDDDGSTGRELRIFKRTGTAWKLIKKSSSPLKCHECGGMYNDPFAEMTIERGSIVIRQQGKSGTGEGETTDRYRFQNGDWYLIGSTSSYTDTRTDDNCGSWQKEDINYSTGAWELSNSPLFDEKGCAEKETFTSGRNPKYRPILMDSVDFYTE